MEKLSNPEFDVECLKNDAERPKDFPCFPSDLLGRSQVAKPTSRTPHDPELSAKDEEILSKLNLTRYGFHGTSNDFWFHSTKPTQGKTPNMVMGDGRIEAGLSRHDFVKSLINDEVQAFQIAGEDKLGGLKLITVVKNNKTNITTMYTCDSKQCYPKALDGNIDNNKLASAITNNLTSIQGVTVWKE